MVVTPNMQRQHLEIFLMCDELVGLLNDLKKKNNSDEYTKKVIKRLNIMLGKLLVHLSMEDKVLYPKALAAVDYPQLVSKATELVHEAGHLKDTVLSYRQTILLPGSVQNINTFVQDTLQLIKVIRNRNYREEQELYPMFSLYTKEIRTVSEFQPIIPKGSFKPYALK